MGCFLTHAAIRLLWTVRVVWSRAQIGHDPAGWQLLLSWLHGPAAHCQVRAAQCQHSDNIAPGLTNFFFSGKTKTMCMQVHGPQMPVVVVGYQLVKQNVSLWTSSRVITHFVGVPGNGQTSADLYQLAFRSGGFTREVWPAACLNRAADRVSALYCMLRGTLHPGEQQSMNSFCTTGPTCAS